MVDVTSFQGTYRLVLLILACILLFSNLLKRIPLFGVFTYLGKLALIIMIIIGFADSSYMCEEC